MKRWCKKRNSLFLCLIILLVLNVLNGLQKILDKEEFLNIKKFYKFEHELTNRTVFRLEKKIAQAPTKLIITTTATTNNNNSDGNKIKENSRIITTIISTKQAEKYLLKINEERINRLFKILHGKELNYGKVLNNLDVLSFEKLIFKIKPGTNQTQRFSGEIQKYLKVANKEIVATDEFISYLTNLSDYHSFINPRNSVKRTKITDENKKPVLVTAANSDYFNALQATVHYIHIHFASHKLIVYDLGLNQDQLDLTLRNCKCTVKKFDQNETYSSVSLFVKNLKKYSWKPIIIQETLKEHDTVLYIDSSIRFKAGDIEPLVTACQNVGLLTQFIGFNLICYTAMSQFSWFGEEWKTFEEIFTIEANILMFHRNFITNLIMKAWVTCALDENCMAPIEIQPSQPCYTSHRYDQDALTIISSFFYGHPTLKKQFLPAYSFTTNESYFFEIKRYDGFNVWT